MPCFPGVSFKNYSPATPRLVHVHVSARKSSRYIDSLGFSMNFPMHWPGTKAIMIEGVSTRNMSAWVERAAGRRASLPE